MQIECAGEKAWFFLRRYLELSLDLTFLLSAVVSQTDNYIAKWFMHLRHCTLISCLFFFQDSFTFDSKLPLRSSPRPISIGKLHALLRFHLRPINLIVFKGSYSYDGIPYLEVSFTLRCFQRLSAPHFATLPCHWRDNRCTIGAFIPVLSY